MIALCSYWTVPEGFRTVSVARNMPSGVSMPELRFLAPLSELGLKVSMTSAGGSPKAYSDAYFAGLRSRRREVEAWLAGLDPGEDLALCCWCNAGFGKAKEQIAEHGTFVCHTMLIGKLVRKYRRDVRVEPDQDRWVYSEYTWVSKEDIADGRERCRAESERRRGKGRVPVQARAGVAPAREGEAGQEVRPEGRPKRLVPLRERQEVQEVLPREG